jgi:inner membrane transporter RhtA
LSFVLLSISSVQVGAALAKSLFPAVGPFGTVSLRVASAAIILLVVWHSSLRKNYGWAAYRSAALLGLVLAAMNLSFYVSISQIPLGIAVTLEFVGPLTLAAILSRKLIDILCVVLAACGILLLAPLHNSTGLSLTGMGFALFAGMCWAFYVLATAKVGSVFPGGTGLTLATTIAALLLLPTGILQAKLALLNPLNLLTGVGVGLLSSALPYSLEMEALRHLPSRTFSILLSLEPAVAALAGFLILHEHLAWQALLAMLLICTASIGAVFFRHEAKVV